MKNHTQLYAQAYAALNPEQQLAVDTIEGPVMVVAGPGTGKTQVIALRLANILLQTDVDPGNLLALTFTESGAVAMRRRLASLVGAAANRIGVYTFHGFCAEVMRNYPDNFVDQSGDPVSDLDKLTYLSQILLSQKPKLLAPRNRPDYYLSAIISAISTLKREGVSVKDFATLLESEASTLMASEGEIKKSTYATLLRQLAKQQELLPIYEQYELTLRSHRQVDFDDQINLVNAAIQADEVLKLSLEERYQYLLVDEYQDTNNSQNKLLMQLTSHWGSSANLFVTGDPDQSIMRFQGASLANQLTFLSRYPSAKVITLRQNYRSTQPILNAAHHLITNNRQRLTKVVEIPDVPLHSQSSSQTPIKAVFTETGEDELSYLATDLARLIHAGEAPDSIAVIYRTNAEAKKISFALTRQNLPHSIAGSLDLLTDPLIVNVLTLIDALLKLRLGEDETSLFTVLHYPCFNILVEDILLLSRTAALTRQTLWSTLTSSDSLENLGLKKPESLIKFRQIFLDLERFDANNSCLLTFPTLLKETGYLNYVLARPDNHALLLKLSALHSELVRIHNSNPTLKLADFLDKLTLMQKHNLRIESELIHLPGTVTLTTAHKSKGLEWDHVYLYHCSDGVWGNSRHVELLPLPSQIIKTGLTLEKDDNEEERCLYYVALTRAKKTLTLTRAGRYNRGGKVRELADTPFLTELTELDNLTLPPESTPSYSELTPPLNDSSHDQQFLGPLVENFALSVTALNLYLKCPYLFKVEKILKLPKARPPQFSFGTAIHKALEFYFRRLRDDSLPPPLKATLDAFNQSLVKEPLPKHLFPIYHRDGIAIITDYLANLPAQKPPLFLEHSLHARLDGGVVIRGTLDRVEWADQASRSLRVIDYKTGSSKSLNYILGKTAEANQDLLRQLVFYRLLIERDPSLRSHQLTEAVLDFVSEWHLNHKDGRRALTISDDQLKSLESEVVTVYTKIKNLEFPRTTNQKNCQECPLRPHCYPEGLPLQ